MSKPAQPELVKPAKNASIANMRPKLKWNAVPCAQRYRVVVKDSVTGQVVDKKVGLTRVRYRTDPLPTGRSYDWFVKTCDESFGCAKSEVRQFTIH
jgi:hypothetical protein